MHNWPPLPKQWPQFFDNNRLFANSKTQRTQQTWKKTLSVSVSAISFIIPSLFILWSQTEWLKSQSKRQQMKCFPLPSKRAEPGSKNRGYFVYPAYSTIKICGHIHKLNIQNDSQERHGRVFHHTGIMRTHGFTFSFLSIFSPDCECCILCALIGQCKYKVLMSVWEW